MKLTKHDVSVWTGLKRLTVGGPWRAAAETTLNILVPQRILLRLFVTSSFSYVGRCLSARQWKQNRSRRVTEPYLIIWWYYYYYY
jgi:hypothetical protein